MLIVVYAEGPNKPLMLSVIMMNVVMMSVIMLIVMVPEATIIVESCKELFPCKKY